MSPRNSPRSVPLTARLLVLGLILLTGCQTLSPDRQAPGLSGAAAEPPSWTAPLDGKTAKQVNGWLADFGDPSLRRFVLKAVEDNQDLKALAARMRTAKARSVIAGADRFPSVSGALDARRAERIETREVPVPVEPAPTAPAQTTTSATSPAMTPAPVPNPAPAETTTIRLKEFTDQFELGLNVSWEIDVWGRLRNRARAGIADYEAAQADYHAAKLSLAANTAKAWLNVIESQQLVALAEQTVASFDETLKSVDSSFSRGIGEITAVELALSKSNVASARGNLAARRRERDAAKRSLETLLGRYPSGAIAASDTLPKLKRAIPVGLPSELLVRRPDILAIERRFAAAIERVAESKKALLPSFRLTGSTGTSSSDLSKLLNRNLILSSVAGSIGQSILEGGRLRADVEVSKATQDELAQDYAATALVAFREVETALAAESYLAAQAEALREASREAVFAEERSQSRFSSGLSPFITLLESQRRAFDSRSAHIRAENQRLQNRIDLYLALGGDFDTKGTIPAAPAPSGIPDAP